VEARGSLFTVNGSGTNAFDRIQSEISGVYRIGIQPDRRDHDGRLHSLRIDVPWNGAVVRSPHEILNLPPAVPSGTVEQVVAAALASPLAMPALPLRVSTFALQSVDPGKVQILIHADIGTDFSAARRVAVGYSILDQSGQAVETRRADSRLPPVMNGLPSALQFAAGASLAPGDYTLKFVAADGSRIGSLEHRFKAKLTDAGGVSLSELIVGGPTAGGELLTPTIGYTINFGSLHGYLEAYGPQAEAVTVKYEIATGSSSNALLAADVPGRLFGDDRMIFTLVMPVEQLPPGRYTLRAMVSLATRPLKTLTRSFEIAARTLPRPATEVAAAPAAPGAPESAGALESTGAADLFLPADDPAFLRPFASAEALRPDVLNPFRDRVAPIARPAFDAGVTSLAAGEYEKAQASFKSGIQPDIDSTPLLAYLAVAYAATGDDAEAASVWETALADGGDIAQIYVWLGQTLLRNHSLPAALDVLEEANGKWPGDARLSEPLAAVYASLGKGREAVRLLEQYLESGAEGAEAAEAARVGVEWIYQIHAAGRVVHSGADDVKLAQAWAARYGNGPQQALVRQWLDTLERESR
jgi:tetratricopeptide (TPR) repeat protein